MIILLSGNSCTGKTLMSQKLLEKYKMPYFSVDHLKMGLYRGAENCGFMPLDSNEVIGEKLWPILKGIIMTNIENDQNLIIEGCYLLPPYVKEIEMVYPDRIISAFLGFSSKYIKENFSKIIEHRNAIEYRKYPEERTMNEHIGAHAEFRTKCLEWDVNYFEIDQNYEKEIQKVYRYIDARMGALRRPVRWNDSTNSKC